MTATVDYYEILGVTPDASPDQLRHAFRARARERHPDRNPGRAKASEEMRVLLEAWEILSDPVRRAHYDSARAMPPDQTAQDVFRSEARTARANASTYSGTWKDFEAWQEGILRDFENTRYSQTVQDAINPGQRKGSLSGVAFLVCGGLVTTLLAFPFMSRFAGTTSGGVFDWMGNYFPVLVPPYIAGAILGLGLHAFIRTILVSRRSIMPTSDAPSSIISCGTCRQKLRLPSTPGRVRITCPACRTEFYRTVAS